jgi:hypothetical protein
MPIRSHLGMLTPHLSTEMTQTPHQIALQTTPEFPQSPDRDLSNRPFLVTISSLSLNLKLATCNLKRQTRGSP